MVHSEHAFSELVGLAYDAATESRGWTLLLQRLETVLRAPFCALQTVDIASGTCAVSAEIGYDPAFRRSYEEYYVFRNPFVTQGRALLRAGLVVQDDVLCPSSILRKTEFHSDWIAPQRMGRGVNATIQVDGSHVSLLVLVRPMGKHALDEGDLALLRGLVPHVDRAMRLRQRHAALHQGLARAQGGLDALASGIIVLDHDGRIVLTNRAASEILARGDGLRAGPAGLGVTVAAESAQLSALIRATRPSLKGAPEAGVLNVSRGLSKHPLQLFVAPFPDAWALETDVRGTTIVWLSDLDIPPEPAAVRLRRLYRLTSAEARVALCLAQGADVQQIAEAQNVSPNTVRTHLKRILDKTQTKRQSALVSVLLRGPLGMRLP